MNVWFRVLVSEAQFDGYKDQIISDLSKRKSLDHKLKKWPKRLFGKSIEGPELKQFLTLKNRRNALMHFSSSHETIIAGSVQISGLSDTLVFETLTRTDAVRALESAEGIIRALFRLKGVEEHQLPNALHAWTGI